ncbi:hypothetical protein [Porphyromonas gulae]|uniref:hypothetical protein n=1 Tax=Porphyromonas gulae TaxID=111105 RepID=UPI00137724D9|nr:hypothetical protein [Porphyromonas gulae]
MKGCVERAVVDQHLEIVMLTHLLRETQADEIHLLPGDADQRLYLCCPDILCHFISYY